jgi:hypothetical protein
MKENQTNRVKGFSFTRFCCPLSSSLEIWKKGSYGSIKMELFLMGINSERNGHVEDNALYFCRYPSILYPSRSLVDTVSESRKMMSIMRIEWLPLLQDAKDDMSQFRILHRRSPFRSLQSDPLAEDIL